MAKVMTHDNTKLSDWWPRANQLFEAAGMRWPNFGEANDAYKMGEAPETFRDWILNGIGADEWNGKERSTCPKCGDASLPEQATGTVNALCDECLGDHLDLHDA